MRIAICEDDKALCADIAELIRQDFSRRMRPCQVHAYESADALWQAYQTGSSPFDLILLDIETPGERNGLDVAKSIREMEDDVIIVILTAFSKYALAGYGVRPFAYLLKPMEEKPLLELLAKAEGRLQLRWRDCLNLTVQGGLLRIPFAEIYCLESQGHHTYIHTHGEVYKQYAKLSDLVAMCDDRFLHTHKSYVVNADHIRWIGRRYTVVELANGKMVPISQPKRKEFIKELAEYDRKFSPVSIYGKES